MQFVVETYPRHPIRGECIRVYDRQGRAGRQILVIEARRGLTREIVAWIYEAAVCFTVSSVGAQVTSVGVIELPTMLDSRSAKPPAALSSTSSMAKEGCNERSLP